MAPPRPIGTVTLSFGLVSVPTKLFSATTSNPGVSFNLLHKECGSRLKQKYICLKDGQAVERADMIKGFEFAKDQYVTFTNEELKEVEEKATQTIEITEFVKADLIDPVYFTDPYYLAPDKGGDKAYGLLAEAMRRTGKSALGKYAARGKQYLVLLRVVSDGLVMHALHYADEVRPFSEVGIGLPQAKEAEVGLAVMLIDQITCAKFEPEKYRDEVKDRIEKSIQQKIEGRQIATSPSTSAPAQVIDLMEALKASLLRPPSTPAPVPAPVAGFVPAAEATSEEDAGEASSDERKPAKRAPRAAGDKAKASKE